MSPETPPVTKPRSRRGLALAGIAGALALVLVAANGILSRHASEAKLKTFTEVQSVPTVSVISPTTGANKSSLDPVSYTHLTLPTILRV